jgi:anti-sigma factor RsiW
MNCREVEENLLDVATGTPVPAAVSEHVAACAACSARVESVHQSMALLDEWKAPGPSPYFDTRLQARLREEAARPASIFAWLRRPALALTMAGLIAVGALTLIHGGNAPIEEGQLQPQPGTAVFDLQRLDKNHELLANFDILDDLEDMNPQSQMVNQ